MFQEAEFWVAIAFFAFLALMLYMGVPKMLGKSLDKRADDIKKDLEEARRLKDEAKVLVWENWTEPLQAKCGSGLSDYRVMSAVVVVIFITLYAVFR